MAKVRGRWMVLGMTALALLTLAGCATSSKADGSASTMRNAAHADRPATAGEPGRFALVDGRPVTPQPIPMGNPATIERVIAEGWERSRVMSHVHELCVTIGPRLTGSDACFRANEWTRDQFASWGLDARLEPWGTMAVNWNRGPQWGRVLIKTADARRGVPAPARGDDQDALRQKTRPVQDLAREQPLPEGFRLLRPIEFTTQAWSPGTDGPRRGPVVRMPQTQEQYDAIKDRLNGAWVLVPRVPMGETPGVDTRRGANQRARWEQRADARKKVADGAAPESLPVQQRILFDGVLGFISASPDDRIWTSGAPNWRTRTLEEYPPDIEVNVRLSDYDYINSRLIDGDAIEVEFNLPVTIRPGPNTLYNTVAEIRGTERPDEVVIICAHLDSWDGPGSQGTVDNATGVAVTLEAARLLAAAGARPKRTIRFILWTGEEQGLLGARAYVQQRKDEWPRISAVFNEDGGTNYQGGLAVIREMVPFLAAATAPVNGRFYSEVDRKWLDVNLRVTPRFTQVAASDHFAFVEVGIPGFFWDEVGRADYWYAWHTQNDRIDQAIEEYLKQSAICSAVVAYQIASAPDLVPRWRPDEPTQADPIAPDGQAGPGQRPRN